MGGITTGVHVCQETEETGDDNTPDGETTLGASLEDSGHLSLESQGVKGTRRSVEIRVTGRPGGNEKHSVDDRREGLDACGLNGNDEGRRVSVTGTVKKVGLGVGDEDGDDESAHDVEEEQSVEDLLDSTGHSLSGVLSLSQSSSDDLSSDEGECGLHQDTPEREELSPRATDLAIASRLLGEGTGVSPVPETDRIVRGSTATHKDDTENDETDNSDDLDSTEPEFGFTIRSCAPEVDEPDHNQENSDVHCSVGCSVPVRNNDCGGNNFGGNSDGI